MQSKKEKTGCQKKKQETKLKAKESLGLSGWRVKAGPRNRPTQKEREGARSNTRAVQRLVHTLYDGQRTHPSPRKQTIRVGINRDDPQVRWITNYFMKMKSVVNAQHNIRRVDNLHCGERRQASGHHEQCCFEARSWRYRGQLREL